MYSPNPILRSGSSRDLVPEAHVRLFPDISSSLEKPSSWEAEYVG